MLFIIMLLIVIFVARFSVITIIVIVSFDEIFYQTNIFLETQVKVELKIDF